MTYEISAAEHRFWSNFAKAPLKNPPLATVLFVYPGVGVGMRFPQHSGCTSQLCHLRDLTAEFAKLGVDLVATSPETPEARLAVGSLPFPILPLSLNSGENPYLFTDAKGYPERTTLILFSDRGLRLGGALSGTAQVDEAFQIVTRYQEAKCLLELAKAAEESVFSKTPCPWKVTRESLANGADSLAITRMVFQGEAVLKIGSPSVVGEEGQYIQERNQALGSVSAPVFPDVYAQVQWGKTTGYLMQGLSSESMDSWAFDDPQRTKLNRRGEDATRHLIQSLASLHASSQVKATPGATDYLYEGRFLAVPKREDFLNTYRNLSGQALPWEEIAKKPIRFASGEMARSYESALRCLRGAELSINTLARCHGDPHLKNIMADKTGEKVYLIDPRIRWEGNAVGEAGLGDSMYDYATLFHSLYPMSAILRNLEQGTGKIEVRVDSEIVVGPNGMNPAQHPSEAFFQEALVSTIGLENLSAQWETRLWLGSANALLGWLKYERSLQNHFGWWSVYLNMMYHLERGCQLIENIAKAKCASF